jgi:hypothetical protein
VRRAKSTTRVASSASGSPARRRTSTVPPAPSAALRRQARAGLIREGGPEARMDVVALDYVPPPAEENGRRCCRLACYGVGTARHRYGTCCAQVYAMLRLG